MEVELVRVSIEDAELVWNMQLKAFEALQSSFDKKIIHNPTAIDVWFCHNGEDYCIKAGETLYL